MTLVQILEYIIFVEFAPIFNVLRSLIMIVLDYYYLYGLVDLSRGLTAAARTTRTSPASL